MAHFPIDNNKDLQEAVNYLLSGPTSIGQNFEGVSRTATPANNTVTALPYAYEMFTNAAAAPFATATTHTGDATTPDVNTYWPQLSTIDYYANDGIQPYPGPIPNIAITDITPDANNLGRILVDVTVNNIWIPPTTTAFPNTQLQITENGPGNPFSENQIVTISGVTPAVYNGNYKLQNYVAGPTVSNIDLIRLDGEQAWTTYTSGGQVSWQNQSIVTDLFAVVQVTGPTDRVFVTCQAPVKGYVFNPVYYTLSPGFPAPTFSLRINRYRATARTDLPNGAQRFPYLHDGFVYAFDETIVDVPYDAFPDAAIIDSGYTFFQPDIFTFNNVIDSPGIGYYLYTFEVYVDNPYYDPDNPTTTPNIIPIALATYSFRSFTAQVIKR